jgi:S-DNA-T family DNA segregation ATPase FtsK/SpoIIIE
VDRCDECNFVYDAVPLDRVITEIRALPRQYSDRLTAADRVGAARSRVLAGTWSALEYTCHVRDVLKIQRERLSTALAEQRPWFTPMRRDERAVEQRYNEQDVEAVLYELKQAARSLADVFVALDDQQWDRTAVYNWPETAERTMAWLARHTLHEGVHHLRDIDAIIGKAPP